MADFPNTPGPWPMMTAYEMFVLAVAGANGGLFYWAISRRQQVLAWIKTRRG